MLAVDYFSYRYWVLLGIIINTAVTFVWERVLIAYLEKLFERKDSAKRDDEFEKKMEEFKAVAK